MEEAKLMIKKCKELGLFAAKFQLFNEGNITNPEHVEYCMARSLDFDKAKELFEYGKEIGQEVFFTPMFPEAVTWIIEMEIDYYKVRYYDQSNLELIYAIYSNMELFGDMCFISTDYPNLYNKLGFSPLYCIPKYPATFEDYRWIMRKFEQTNYHGISDHTKDLELLKYFLKEDKKSFSDIIYYFERHVCLTKENCLEVEWACTFQELEEVLK